MNTAHGAVITPPIEVSVLDSLRNLVKTFTGNTTLAIASGTGTAGAVLSGSTTVAAVAGVATFSDLSIDLVGTGYGLTANSAPLPTRTSFAFSIN